MWHLYIAGVEQINTVILQSFKVDNILTQAVDTLTFQIKNTKPTEGQEVTVIDDTLGVLFGGIIDQVKIVRDNPLYIYQIECQDYTYQLNQRLVVETYANWAADYIVKDIILKYCPSFTANNVELGAPVVEEIIFDYKQPSDCFKDLADYVGWDWYVDFDRDVHFFNPLDISESAPVQITGNSKIRNFKHGIDTQGLRNRVFIRGGTMLSDIYSYEIKADGTARIWNLPHKPHELSMAVNGTPVSVGIENVDKDMDFDYLLNFQEKYVKASDAKGTPTVTEGATLRWIYKYDIDVITTVEDFTSQNALAAIQGGDGAYEHIIADDSLTTLEAAEAAGNADLKENANPKVKGSFETGIPGWKPGQLVSIDLSDRGITGTFLVQTVTLEPTSLGNWIYTVEYGGRLLGIADFLKALVSSQQKKQVNQTTILHKYVYGSEKPGVTDELTTTSRALPYLCGDVDAICGLVPCSNGT